MTGTFAAEHLYPCCEGTMPPDSPTSDHRDRLLNEILVAILRLVESGQAPDWQGLLEGHPETRKELARFFAGLSALMWMVAPEKSAPPSGPAAPNR